jgi:hypothetical protein
MAQRPALSAAVECDKVGSLADLVDRYPALRDVIRHYGSLDYVPVVMNTCTLPQRSDVTLYDDRVVFGLFYVDRAEARKPQSIKVIRQDYFVGWTDGSGEMRYYSGEKRTWRKTGHPIHWRDIDDFCVRDQFAGPGGCYGCEPRPSTNDPIRPKHWYSEYDPDLPAEPKPVWRLAFDLALAVARVMP